LKAEEQETKMAKNEDKKVSRFSGNVDAGLQVANGNTKKQDLNGSAKLNYKGDGWSNTLNLSARGSEEGQVRTNEEYIVNNQTKYDLTEKSYSFLEMEYVNDRFSGYEYRISELLGLGYKIYDNDKFKLSSEMSAGGRQSKLTDDTKENSMVGKLSAKAEWNIYDDIILIQDINSSFGSESVITIWDTSIRKNITESLYMKFNYNLQHIDDVPVGVQHIDTFTSVGVGYQF
jgi:putative salt-induced outer membrane protein